MDVTAGDTVHVRAHVLSVHPDRAESVRLNVNGKIINVMLGCVVHVEPRPLQVGDTVTWGERGVRAKIRHIIGERAWVSGASVDCIKDLTGLERPPCS